MLVCTRRTTVPVACTVTCLIRCLVLKQVVFAARRTLSVVMRIVKAHCSTSLKILLIASLAWLMNMKPCLRITVFGSSVRWALVLLRQNVHVSSALLVRCCVVQVSHGICVRSSLMRPTTIWILIFRLALTVIAMTVILCALQRCANQQASLSNVLHGYVKTQVQ